MRLIYSIIISILITQPSFADLLDRPDGHAPIGVMGDHGHKKSELMLSYRLMLMQMKDLQSGTNTVSSNDLFSSTPFMMAPKKMDMWMHMFGAMYGLTDKLTLMIMTPYVSNKMTMARKMQNDETETESSGLGDVTLSGLYTIQENSNQRIIMKLGVLFPTGSIEKELNGTRLGYAMQLGSGSYGLQPGFIYSHYWDHFSLGTNFHLKYYLNENNSNYKLGTKYQTDFWGAYNICDNFSSSLRLSHESTDPTDKSDIRINSMMSPSNRANLLHGNITTLYLGGNFLGTEIIKGHRIALEIGAPIYQDLNGPQMKRTLTGYLGWQKVF